MDRWRGCEGEMLCYQEATYKIIRHRRGPRPLPRSSANRRRVHLNRNPSCIVDSLSFFSPRAECHGPEHVCPAGCANIRNRNMNIPGWGCRSWYSSPPTSFPHPPPSMSMVLSSLGTNPFHAHVCRSRAHLFTCVRESAISILVPFLRRAISEKGAGAGGGGQEGSKET